LENLVNQNLFGGSYKGKKVFLTGHSGFKGSWMALWLKELGADVKGYSLAPNTDPNHIDLLKLDIDSVYGDIRDFEKLKKEIHNYQPDIVFHMAAQPLVRYSYREPRETYETNVIGSLNLYEACRDCSSVKSIVSVTTDKVYENNEWVWGYRENDRLGGKDPYSASKAAMEIMTSSYRTSFFNPDKWGKDHEVLLAVARAGNVIGGGDWAEDRLIPDIIRASLKGVPTEIRSPDAVRPWQHVLEPLSGYLLLGQMLMEKKANFAEAFNFGPLVHEELTVGEVVEFMKGQWNKVNYEIKRPDVVLHESRLLKLDCTKAHNELGWKPVWTTEEGLARTIDWYKAYYEVEKMDTSSDLSLFVKKAKDQNAIWTK
jgi:CDP-glucose 4,6-dehydratase